VTAPGGITCREVVELVSDYVDGSLEPEPRVRLEVHLRACEACTEYVRQIRTTVRLASAAALEQHPDGAALLEAFRSFRRR
jgi:anti-sigma factor RsiW